MFSVRCKAVISAVLMCLSVSALSEQIVFGPEPVRAQVERPSGWILKNINDGARQGIELSSPDRNSRVSFLFENKQGRDLKEYAVSQSAALGMLNVKRLNAQTYGLFPDDSARKQSVSVGIIDDYFLTTAIFGSDVQALKAVCRSFKRAH